MEAVGRKQDLRIPKLEIIARTVDEDDVINAAELLEERRNEETAAIIEGHVFQQAEFPLHCRRAIIAFAPGQGELLFMIDVRAQGLLIAVTEPGDAGIFFMLGEAEAVQIGRANVLTPDTKAHLVYRPLREEQDD